MWTGCFSQISHGWTTTVSHHDPCLVQSKSRIILFCTLIESSHSRQCLATNSALQSEGSLTDVLNPSARPAKCNLYVSTLSQPECWKRKPQEYLTTGAVILSGRFLCQLIIKIMLCGIFMVWTYIQDVVTWSACFLCIECLFSLSWLLYFWNIRYLKHHSCHVKYTYVYLKSVQLWA